MSANHRGEIRLPVGDKTYTLVCDLSAMCALEEHFSTPGHEVTFEDVFKRVNANSMRHTRAFIWAALRTHHPEVTIEQIGAIVTEAGGLLHFSKQIEALAEGMTADREDLAALEDAAGPRPRTAQTKRRGGVNGSGDRSHSKLAATV